MGRLIDANELKMSVILPRCGAKTTIGDAICKMIDSAPTVDAVPSETLYNFIREIGAITYGKERFPRLAGVKIFNEEIGARCGLWYDLKSREWITTQKAIEECLKAVRKLYGGVPDAEPIKHGKWIPHEDEYGEHDGDKCSECGELYVMPYGKTKRCPNCGARMDKDARKAIDEEVERSWEYAEDD